MSDVETWGFPRVQPTGSSPQGAIGGTRNPDHQRTPSARPAFGAWECLGHALASESPKAAHWAVDACRVILGLDTLYAAERR